LYVFPLRETWWTVPRSRYASARKPSYFTSVKANLKAIGFDYKLAENWAAAQQTVGAAEKGGSAE